MKYFVRVMRPVFQESVIEVDATNEEEAVMDALKKAALQPEQNWSGQFDDENYAQQIVEVVPEDELKGSDVSDQDFDVTLKRYALLEASTESGEGQVAPQPWMQEISGLMLADICGDWSDELEEFKQEGLNDFTRFLERHQDDHRPPPGVASFGAYYWRKRKRLLH